MRQNRHYLLDMSYLEDFGVLTGVRVSVWKFFGVRAGVFKLETWAMLESKNVIL